MCLSPQYPHSHHEITLQFGWLGPIPPHSEMCSLGKADQGKLCHRNLFRHPRPEPINTVLDTRFGESPLIRVKHLTCVVTGPSSGSEGGRTWPLFLLAAICFPEGRWPPGHTRNPRVTETQVVWRRSPLETSFFTFLLYKSIKPLNLGQFQMNLLLLVNEKNPKLYTSSWALHKHPRE